MYPSSSIGITPLASQIMPDFSFSDHVVLMRFRLNEKNLFAFIEAVEKVCEFKAGPNIGECSQKLLMGLKFYFTEAYDHLKALKISQEDYQMVVMRIFLAITRFSGKEHPLKTHIFEVIYEMLYPFPEYQQSLFQSIGIILDINDHWIVDGCAFLQKLYEGFMPPIEQHMEAFAPYVKNFGYLFPNPFEFVLQYAAYHCERDSRYGLLNPILSCLFEEASHPESKDRVPASSLVKDALERLLVSREFMNLEAGEAYKHITNIYAHFSIDPESPLMGRLSNALLDCANKPTIIRLVKTSNGSETQYTRQVERHVINVANVSRIFKLFLKEKERWQPAKSKIEQLFAKGFELCDFEKIIDADNVAEFGLDSLRVCQKFGLDQKECKDMLTIRFFTQICSMLETEVSKFPVIDGGGKACSLLSNPNGIIRYRAKQLTLFRANIEYLNQLLPQLNEVHPALKKEHFLIVRNHMVNLNFSRIQIAGRKYVITLSFEAASIDEYT